MPIKDIKSTIKNRVDSIDKDALAAQAQKAGGRARELAGKAGDKLAENGFDAAEITVKAKELTNKAGDKLFENAGKAKDAAMEAKEDLDAKLHELDRMLEQSITEYNDAYTLMNDRGIKLFMERQRSVDSIGFVEELVNSIANKPKVFDADFKEIDIAKKQFTDSCDFANKELQAARVAAGGAGAGLAAGASVAFMAPTAAMWVATTFGTASTGTAISALSGAAASNAALAWLGGGTLAAGGGGISAGTAFLAMAGPVGWTIAGATLLSSILIFSTKRSKLNKQKNEEIELIKNNTEKIKEVDAELIGLLDATVGIRDELNRTYSDCARFNGRDYMSFNESEKLQLGALVNNAKALSAMFAKTVEA